jgi:hypothetical protein
MKKIKPQTKQAPAVAELRRRFDGVLSTFEVGPEHLDLLLTEEQLENVLSTMTPQELEHTGGRRAYKDSAQQIRFWNKR